MTRRRVSADPHPLFAEAISVTRFWGLVERRSKDNCWPWLGDTDRNGYGVFFFNGKVYGAHELSLSFSTGEKRLDGLDTCHSCDTPECVNPAHLRFDSRLSNVRDMHARGRQGRSGKLTDEKITEIRKRRANGARQIDLARDYGVSDGQISMIVRGKRWAEVGGPIEKDRAQYRKGA